MKRLAIFLIGIYQIFAPFFLRFFTGQPAICRFKPTCSEYTKLVIAKYGVVKGAVAGVKRILSCNPFVAS